MTKKEKIAELENRITDYFSLCDSLNEEKIRQSKQSKGDGKPQKPYTMSGLLSHMGLSYREFEQLRTRRDFRRLLDGAKSRIEAYIEEKSLTGELSSNASQASLKYYFGWGEKYDLFDTRSEKSETCSVVEVVLTDEANDLAQ